ncbi:MAG: hypothetical protein AAFP99_08635, partial [Pseudomonadota bacterium]
TCPLEDTFTHWDWARGSLPDDQSVIFYDTQRRDGSRGMLALQFDEDGAVTHVDPPAPQAVKSGVWGVARNAHSDAESAPALKASYEDGPFYLRAKIGSQIGGEPVDLMHESFSGERFGQWWVKAMLPFRMPRRSWFGLLYIPILMGTPSLIAILAYVWLSS